MSALFGSLFGLFGTAQLHTVLLVGMLVLVIFRPERIAGWRTFRVSVVLFVLAVALPGLVMLTAAEKGGDFADQLILRAVLATSGLLTASSIYFLLSCLARPASRGDAP
jgi:hypothetical protein